MLSNSRAKRLLPLLLLPFLASCSKQQDDAATPAAFSADGSLLQYVADDSPYVLAMLKPLPDALMDKFEPQIDLTLKSYREIIRSALQEGANKEEDDPEARARLLKVAEGFEALSDLFTLDGLRNAGIGRESTAVFYGAGLLPVTRIRLTDPAAFEATIARVESESGTTLETGAVDDQSYRYAGNDEVRVLLAMSGNDLVISIVPAKIGDDALREIFGLAPPTNSMAASGRLQKLASDNGYTAHGAGFVELERIAGAFLDEPAGTNVDLMRALDYSSDSLSPVCKSELRGLAGIMPRAVTGYTDVSVKRIASNTILELRKDIADGLATLVAPVPGLGSDPGGIFSFGMSIDLLATREFYAARLDALDAAPFECELLADLQAGLQQGRQMLNQPVPPMVYGVKGFLAVVENIEGLDVASKTPPTSIDMRFLLATENAPGLLAMGSMFSPELAALNLQSDGKPVRFESPQLQAAPVDAAYVAMNDTALAVSVGEGTDAALGKMMGARTGNPPPFMSMQMDAGRYYAFIGEAISAASEQGDKDMPVEINAALNDVMQGFGKLADRLTLDVMFTDRGIELPSELTLTE